MRPWNSHILFIPDCMPIEIRELIIRTSVVGDHSENAKLSAQDLSNLKNTLRRQVMEDCKRLIENKIRDRKER